MNDAVEVCAICDIAGCYHIRERKARAAAPVVAVKPLVWRQSNERCISADAPGFAAYTIFTRDDGQFSLRMSWSLLMTDGYFDTLHAAKAAAQADYNARIMSALDTAPADPLADERVRKLVEVLRNEQAYWQTKADADWRDQEVEELVIDYPTPRKMTEAMKRADELQAALAAIEAQP